MHQLLENIFQTKTYTNSKNEVIQIHSETSRGQCEFLQKIIAEYKFKNSIEIGFAYGMSTLAITEEIVKNNGTHVVIDRYENISWGGIGLDLINKAGYSNSLKFHEELSHNVLPKLLAGGERFDFAYVDTTKLFDWLMVDFFFLDKLLEPNGIIVLDDVAFKSIRKLSRFISQLPHYKVYEAYPKNYEVSAARKVISLLSRLPKSEVYLKEDIIIPDNSLGINSNCVAFKKIEDDKRNWDWHKEF